VPVAMSGSAQPPSTTPQHHRRSRRGRLVWLLAAVALLVPATAMSPQPVEAGSCTGWTSKTIPPNSIRVLRRDGSVEKVDFRRYVGVVMASGEWPASMPRSLLQAGAVAVKQFAWYHTLKGNHRSSYVTASGKCYDVTDTTRDQLYKPERSTVRDSQWRAIDATWGLSVRKNGRFILTQYRLGNNVGCARDADGRKIFQRSARNCAQKGWSARQILAAYYGGSSVSFAGGGGGGGAATTPKPKATAKPKSTPKPKATPTPTPETASAPWWEAFPGERFGLDGYLLNLDVLDELANHDPNALLAAVHGPEVRSGAVHVALSTSPSFASGPAALTADNAGTATATADPLPMSAEVTFWGSTLVIFDSPTSDRGVLSVYVDDQLMTIIDLSATEPPAMAFYHEWAEPTQHRVQLVLSPPVAGEVVDLEALLIHF
jgi:hypothetical protein